MTRSDSPRHTTGSPMPEDTESQDSQAILEALKAELGVAATQTTNSNHDRLSREQTPYIGQDDSRLGLVSETSFGQPGNLVDPPPRPAVVEQLLRAQALPDAETNLADQAQDDATTQDTTFDEPIQLVDTQRVSQDNPDALPDSIAAPLSVPSGTSGPSRKMDPSQDTPTQANEDRDYRDYCQSLASSPAGANPKENPEEDHTLQPDDTGAVNFGNLTQMARPSSQVSEDAGFETTKGDWRMTEQTPQQLSSLGYTPHRPHGIAPETPALPRNPFASKPSIAAPLAGSQLFGQTQLSSAVKGFSPTSSRPSPNMFLNSISPNMMETSPLKDRANVSSPTDLRTSSPQRLHEVPGTVTRMRLDDIQEIETPLNSRSTGADLIPESPTVQPPKSSGGFQPSAHYEPMKKSQERKMAGEVPTQDLMSGSDSDDAIKRIERRKRIQKVRAMAEEELERVSVPRVARRSSDEPPSRKKRRTLSDDGTWNKSSLDQANPLSDGLKEDLTPRNPVKTVTASDETPTGDVTDTTPRNKPLKTKHAKRGAGSRKKPDLDAGPGDDEVIPATSPVQSSPAEHGKAASSVAEPELPELIPEEVEPDQEGRQGPNNLESSSLPPVRRRGLRTNAERTRRPRRNPFLSSSTSDVISLETGADANTPDPPRFTRSAVVTRTTEERKISTISTTRSAKGQTHASMGEPDPSTPLPSDPAEVSSDLTVLSTTPAPSSATTPGTQDSPTSERTETTTLPSPAVRTSLRKRVLRHAPRSKSPQPGKRVARGLRRSMRIDSESTDELQCSPVPRSADTSLVQPHVSRSYRQSISTPHAGARLFEGMIFAISFQSGQKLQERAKLESKVTQAGGLILQEGFHELFEPCKILKSSSPTYDDEELLKLTKAGCNAGFTALIADSHSRKPKYMQALALGLPCLAQQWITTCLNKGTIVDWQPYLLCAGSSAVLGNAIRSRNMAAYSILDTSLTDMVKTRPRLLDGQRILLVMDSKKPRSEAKEPYIFLAQALGPSMSRVFTVQQARDTLIESEKAGKPFDWCYIDKGTGTAEAVLSAAPEGGGRKRRRSAAQPLVRNLRVLNDELVIQSLILGRIVEEDEMNF